MILAPTPLYRPICLRHVLAPGYTLKQGALEQLADCLKGYICIERIDLLPFRQLGAHKRRELNIPYALDKIVSPTEDEIVVVQEIFRSKELPIY